MINTCPEENASSPLETDSAYAVHIFFNYKYKNYAHHFTIYTPYIQVMYTNFQYVYSSLNLTPSIFMGLLVWSVVAGAGIVLSCLSLLSHQSFDLSFSCHPCYCTYHDLQLRHPHFQRLLHWSFQAF